MQLRLWKQTIHLAIWYRSASEPFLSVGGGGGFSLDEVEITKREKIKEVISQWRVDNQRLFGWINKFMEEK